MIKLIVTDMDGTLVDSEKVLHPETLSCIRQLLDQGKYFAVASGRQFQNLTTHFDGVKDQLIYISDNGTIIHEGFKKVYVDAIEPARVMDLVRDIRKIPGADIVLCGVDSAYIENDDPAYVAAVKVYYEALTIVDSFESLMTDDQICKVSIYDWEGAESNSYPIVTAKNYDFSVNLSGQEWVDFMNTEASKGHAVRFIQEAYGIIKEESMAFGDYMNDYTMMLECGESYAMANAHPDLKAVCKYEAGSNDEAGVVEVLKREFNLK